MAHNAKDWTAIRSPFMRRNVEWFLTADPSVRVRHCGHPTALRPYYIVGREGGRKYRLLSDAQTAALQPADAGA